MNDGIIALHLLQDLTQPPGQHFEVRLCATTTPVGLIFVRFDASPEAGSIGYEIFGAFRGNGYAERACRLIGPLASARGRSHLWIVVDAGNDASRRTVEKLGAQLLEAFEADGRHRLRFRWDL